MAVQERAVSGAVEAQPSCYHCGLPLPPRGDFAVVIDGVPRATCCAGCQAVAQAIVANGLSDYYRHRDSLPASPPEAMPDALRELGLFDHPEVQRSFVQPVGEHEREASLILEGITCAACIWLNEQHVAKQPGVTGVSINYATRRARVRWDERRCKLSDILAAIAAIGYRAHPYDPARSEQLAQKERRTALWRLFVAGFGMMQVMMYAVPAYIADAGTMTPDIDQLLRWASLVLTLPVVFYSAAPFFASAWRDLRLVRAGMDVPVAFGVGSAFAASVWATVTAGGEVYFDSVVMFVFLLLGGRYLEMLARQRAVRGVEELGRIVPALAQRLPDYPARHAEKVPVASLAADDIVLVRPGEVVPADGLVIEGESATEESLLTGESRPVPKVAGSPVTGGSVNRASPLLVRVTQVGEATRLAAIRHLMERAQTEKPRLVVAADRAAGHFIVALLLLSVATGLAWYWIDPARALWVFVSVLVVSCPCALSLATPVALTVATGALSRQGLLVARGHAIETLARATRFVFDKTGTLTHGRLRLAETSTFSGMERERALALAASLERSSEHLIGVGLRAAAGEAAELPASDVRAVTGQGIEGLVAGERHRVGRPEFVAELAGTAPQPAAAGDGATLVGLGRDGAWLALFHLADQLRPEAGPAVAALRQSGRTVSILSGDAPGAVAAVARALGVTDARAGLTPAAKHDAIVDMQRRGEVVAMIGDGVNDAPVLAQAQVSVAMGGGSDLARTQADLVLLSEDLGRLAEGVALAGRTMRIIRQNLLWALGYNLLAIPAAMTGWVTPWMAGIGMSASSLLVVLNALRLQPRPTRARARA